QTRHISLIVATGEKFAPCLQDAGSVLNSSTTKDTKSHKGLSPSEVFLRAPLCPLIRTLLKMQQKEELLQSFRLRPSVLHRDPGFCGRFGVGISLDGVAGAAGATVSGGASVKTFRMKPGGTVAVRIARSPDCSTLRPSENVFTSASVPCAPTLPSAA